MSVNLKLLKSEGIPNPDQRRHLIHLFNLKYREILSEDNPFTFPKCMQAMRTFRFVDEETGEEMIEYPPEETWAKELDGFFKDDWARDNVGFHFTYFIKQFGSFAKRMPKPVVKVKTVLESPWVTCDTCLTDFVKGEQCPKCNP